MSPAGPVASSDEGDHSDAPRPSSSAAGANPKAAAPSIFETAKTCHQREKNKASTHEDKSPMGMGAEPLFEGTSPHLALLTELKSDTKKKPSWQAVAARLGCSVTQAKTRRQDCCNRRNNSLRQFSPLFAKPCQIPRSTAIQQLRTRSQQADQEKVVESYCTRRRQYLTMTESLFGF